jgi:hypothetical protein
MATDNMAGLFATPEQYQQQLSQQALANSATMAQLTPEQSARQMAQFGGYQLAGGIAGAMGAQDPALKLQSLRQQAVQGMDPNNPQSIMQAAQKLAQVDPAGASQLAQMARTANEQIAKTSSEGVVGKAIIAGKYTPESLAKFDKTRNPADLEAIDLSAKPSADWLAIAKELGLKAGRSFNDYSPEEVAAVNTKLFNQSISKAQAARATTVFQQESAFAKTLGEEQAKKLTSAIDQSVTSSDALTRLSQMKKLNDSGTLYQGPQANATVTTANLLNSLGLVSPDEAAKLSNSEVYGKLAKDLVMKDLGGKLGAQVSNSDRDYVEARIPQLTTSPKARTELIAKLQEIHAKNISYSKRMQSYAEKKGSLQGFDFTPDTTSTVVDWSNLPAKKP